MSLMRATLVTVRCEDPRARERPGAGDREADIGARGLGPSGLTPAWRWRGPEVGRSLSLWSAMVGGWRTSEYAPTSGGQHVAFRVYSSGPGEPLLQPPALLYSIESILEDPPYARLINGSADLRSLVLVERRGVATSDPLDASQDAVGTMDRRRCRSRRSTGHRARIADGYPRREKALTGLHNSRGAQLPPNESPRARCAQLRDCFRRTDALENAAQICAHTGVSVPANCDSARPG